MKQKPEKYYVLRVCHYYGKRRRAAKRKPEGREPEVKESISVSKPKKFTKVKNFFPAFRRAVSATAAFFKDAFVIAIVVVVGFYVLRNRSTINYSGRIKSGTFYIVNDTEFSLRFGSEKDAHIEFNRAYDIINEKKPVVNFADYNLVLNGTLSENLYEDDYKDGKGSYLAFQFADINDDPNPNDSIGYLTSELKVSDGYFFLQIEDAFERNISYKLSIEENSTQFGSYKAVITPVNGLSFGDNIQISISGLTNNNTQAAIKNNDAGNEFEMPKAKYLVRNCNEIVLYFDKFYPSSDRDYRIEKSVSSFEVICKYEDELSYSSAFSKEDLHLLGNDSLNVKCKDGGGYLNFGWIGRDGETDLFDAISVSGSFEKISVNGNDYFPYSNDFLQVLQMFMG